MTRFSASAFLMEVKQPWAFILNNIICFICSCLKYKAQKTASFEHFQPSPPETDKVGQRRTESSSVGQ